MIVFNCIYAHAQRAIVGHGGQCSPPPPPQRFKIYISIYNILFLAICFNKIALCPLNNIIDIFKSYIKNIKPTKKIKPKTNTSKKKKKKSKPILTRDLTSLGVGNT